MIKMGRQFVFQIILQLRFYNVIQGPGSAYCQEFLVRGTFLEEDGDEDDEDDDTPEPNTFWVEKSVLLDTIDRRDVKAALEKRHKRVISEL